MNQYVLKISNNIPRFTIIKPSGYGIKVKENIYLEIMVYIKIGESVILGQYQGG